MVVVNGSPCLDSGSNGPNDSAILFINGPIARVPQRKFGKGLISMSKNAAARKICSGVDSIHVSHPE